MDGASGDLRVMIAEDDYLVREGTRSVLEAEAGVEVVGVADEPDALERLLASIPADAVVLDIRMPPTHTTEGIDLALRLRQRYPHLGVVVLSQHADPEYALALLDRGAEHLAYLLKERLGDGAELVRTIREVVAGGSVLDPVIVEALLEARRHRKESALAGLTPRELEVLGLMATGRRNAAIAAELHITERSVEKHCNAIFRKLGLGEEQELNRRVAAVLFFLQRSTG